MIRQTVQAQTNVARVSLPIIRSGHPLNRPPFFVPGSDLWFQGPILVPRSVLRSKGRSSFQVPVLRSKFPFFVPRSTFCSSSFVLCPSFVRRRAQSPNATPMAFAVRRRS
jgi:hypothetical protein